MFQTGSETTTTCRRRVFGRCVGFTVEESILAERTMKRQEGIQDDTCSTVLGRKGFWVVGQMGGGVYDEYYLDNA